MAATAEASPPFAIPAGGLLAGPVLRRAEASRVCVWICTLGPAHASLRVHRAAGGHGEVVGAGTGEPVRLGERLYAHLLTAVPEADRFPSGEVLAYDVQVDAGGTVLNLAGLELSGGEHGLGYGGMRLPGFVLPAPGVPLHVLHGSCRKLDGKGEDAFWCADELLARSATDPARRPSALFLTGDQIYGDDLAPELTAQLHRLGCYLTGRREQIPGLPPGALTGGRERWIRERAHFTSPHAANHLMTFGEYAAAYLMAFSGTVWPAAPALAGNGLAGARAALPAVRRVLANVPTYMIFDDHDVTDDWNLTRGWRDRVRASPSGRRIVANALAAYWAFQGWGNDPRQFGPDFASTVCAHLTEDEDGADGDGGDRDGAHGDGAHSGTTDGGSTDGRAARFDELLWEFGRWSFACPTEPVTICLDTRTQRRYDSPEGGARLLGPEGFARVASLAEGAGHRSGQPLVLVSPTPVCGLELHERRQRYLAGRVGPYEIDFEGWHANLHGLADLMEFLTRRLGLGTAVVLSGDVHYGLTVDVRFTAGDVSVHLAQLVSSAIKHSGTFTRNLLNLLGRLNRSRHERVGWARPPALPRSPGAAQRLLRRRVSTDTWAPEAPVFLSPSLARRLGISQPPDYRESRRYVRPAGPSPSALIGENNIGSVTVDGPEVTHVLLSRGQHTTPHTARLDLSHR